VALEQEKQQLQAALDAKYPPELLAAQVREIDSRIGKTDADKVAKMVEAIYSSMQAGEVLATVPQVAPIADKIMQAGGYQQPAPAGIDPNFPQPAAPVTPAAVDAAMTGPIDVPESGNTSPAFPDRPGSPGVGANEGMEADGMQGFANGGAVHPHNAAFYDPPLDPNSPQQQSFAMVRDEDRDER
jgi:hypothetical protein